MVFLRVRFWIDWVEFRNYASKLFRYKFKFKREIKIRDLFSIHIQ